MASNLSCVGLAVRSVAELDRLVQQILPSAIRLGMSDDVDVYRWEDPSGARLVLGIRKTEVVDLMPSFAGYGPPGVRLDRCHLLNDEVITARVVDDTGEQLTAIAFEIEQRRAVNPALPWTGKASLVAFGTDIQAFAELAAYEASPRSLVDPNADPHEPPPPAVAERGLKWPTRMAEKSFISYGAFGSAEDARAYARLHGRVLASEARRNELTGQYFAVCRIECIGFEVDLLLDSSLEHLPRPGGIVAGTVFLVASIDEWRFPKGAQTDPPRRRFRFGSRS